MSVQEKIENAARCMEAMANDDSHGYDQSARWGPDYDCSSAVIHSWEFADVPVKRNGATYTGNMYSVFTRTGFEDVTAQVNLDTGSGLQRGDVLLHHVKHTAMYIGGGQTAEASINEYGTTTGGQRGDQTGKEFLCRPYRNFPWDCVLRYTGKTSTGGGTGGNTSSAASVNDSPWYFYKVSLPLLKTGMESPYIRALQELLIALGYLSDEADGIYGVRTKNAVLGLQADARLETDGECGGQTWAAVFKAFER